ncbi:MAG: sensor histidine kinase [Burkholderiaceae bacterium]
MSTPARRPGSLTGRVVLTLVASFGAVFAVLLAVLSYQAFAAGTGDIDKTLLANARAMSTGLEHGRSDDAARALIAIFEASGHEAADRAVPPVHLRLARRDGGFEAATTGAPPLEVATVPDGIGGRTIDGVTYRTYSVAGDIWRVVVIDAAQARDWSVIRENGVELAFYVGLALPIVLVPIGLAVITGLAPLRRLSATVAARAPEDMAPLPPARTYRELQPLEAALDRQFARAADSIRREKAFVHDAAHELRTPLAVIATQAHLLAGAQGDDRALALKRLEDSITRASHLAQQLLRLADADAVARAERVTVDLMDLLRDALATLAERADRQHTELSLEGPEQANLRADPHALRSIVDNLLDNALRYGGPGGAVAARLALEADHWTLRIADRGPGLDITQRERAFERFWRGASGTQPGSGLGLAIVREATRALGGSVRLDAGDDGIGCVAVVTWPTDPPVRPGADATAERRAPRFGAG